MKDVAYFFSPNLSQIIFSFITQTVGNFLAQNAVVITQLNLLICLAGFISARLYAARKEVKHE